MARVVLSGYRRAEFFVLLDCTRQQTAQFLAKGRDHFEYVSRGLGNQKIYYVADATAEVQTGKEYSQDYNIVPIGFGNVITVDHVLEAVKLVSQALIVCGIDTIPFPIVVQEIQVDGAKISLSAEHEIEITLCKAGAESVVTGTKERSFRTCADTSKSALCFNRVPPRSINISKASTGKQFRLVGRYRSFPTHTPSSAKSSPRQANPASYRFVRR